MTHTVRDEGGFTVQWLVAAFPWVRVRVYIVYLIFKVCQPHAESFHGSFRGSSFLSRKLPYIWFVIESFRGIIKLLIIISNLWFTSVRESFRGSQFNSTKASVKVSVQVTCVEAFTEASVEITLRGIFHEKLSWKLLLRKLPQLPWKRWKLPWKRWKLSWTST